MVEYTVVGGQHAYLFTSVIEKIAIDTEEEKFIFKE